MKMTIEDTGDDDSVSNAAKEVSKSSKKLIFFQNETTVFFPCCHTKP
jgi:hypothetical protein